MRVHKAHGWLLLELDIEFHHLLGADAHRASIFDAPNSSALLNLISPAAKAPVKNLIIPSRSLCSRGM